MAVVVAQFSGSMAAIGNLKPSRRVLTSSQTQNLDMIACLGPRQGQNCRGEEHSLIVRVRNEQADALVGQGWEARGHDADGVHVQAGKHHYQYRQRAEHGVHGGGWRSAKMAVSTADCLKL